MEVLVVVIAVHIETCPECKRKVALFEQECGEALFSGHSELSFVSALLQNAVSRAASGPSGRVESAAILGLPSDWNDLAFFQYRMSYTENLQGAQFVIKNPNASTTCGCGSSFSI